MAAVAGPAEGPVAGRVLAEASRRRRATPRPRRVEVLPVAARQDPAPGRPRQPGAEELQVALRPAGARPAVPPLVVVPPLGLGRALRAVRSVLVWALRPAL